MHAEAHGLLCAQKRNNLAVMVGADASAGQHLVSRRTYIRLASSKHGAPRTKPPRVMACCRWRCCFVTGERLA